MDLQKRAEALSENVFTGGLPQYFEEVGRLQLISLLKAGLYPTSKVLDIGCGALRAGYWLIHFLNPNCYFGIEPNKEMLQAGIDEFLDEETLKYKQPRFDDNAHFDASVFGTIFDFFLARSIWTHASKDQIVTMLEAFKGFSTERGIFLTSYLPSGIFRHRDYRGSKWVGFSHKSDVAGVVRHSLTWIRNEASLRGMQVEELKEDVFGRQVWLKITRE